MSRLLGYASKLKCNTSKVKSKNTMSSDLPSSQQRKRTKTEKEKDESPDSKPDDAEEQVYVSIMFGVNDNMDTDGYVVGIFPTGQEAVDACAADMERLVGRRPVSAMQWDDDKNDDGEWEYYLDGDHGFRWLVKRGPFPITSGPEMASRSY